MLTIPSYKLSYYESRQNLCDRILKARSKYVITDRLDVAEGLLFPGFYGENPQYQKFYREYFSKVFTPPRGNLEGNFAVIGIAPGFSLKSFGESVMLFGPSSELLHNLLMKLGIYPYFTNIFKKPYENNQTPDYRSDEAKAALDLLYKELQFLFPKTFILLGRYPHYDFVREYLDSKHQKHVTITHPSYVARTGTFEEWFETTKKELKSLQGG